MVTGVEAEAPFNLGDATPTDVSEALKEREREEGPVAITEAQVEAGEAWELAVESPM